jgi:hypothetical protein
MRASILFLAGAAASLAFGWLAFPKFLYERIEQPQQFSHVAHAKKAEMTCDACHSVRADGSFAGVPVLEGCTACHSDVVGKTAAEKAFVENYAKPGKEVPWLVYSRQPDNVHFPHAVHTNLAKLKCEECHGAHGTTARLRILERNRVSGYSRDIWGPRISRVSFDRKRLGMKMDDCMSCHEQHRVAAGCMDCHK